MNISISSLSLEGITPYDVGWIRSSIDDILVKIKSQYNRDVVAYTGLESDIDLYFCQSCIFLGIPYIVCISQQPSLSIKNMETREQLIKTSIETKQVETRWVTEYTDIGICVFDGSEGKTDNVFKELVKNKINFYWINPGGRVTWKCFI